MTALPPQAFIAANCTIGQHVEAAFQSFGASCLSDREAEVARLILRGHSSKVIARMMGNSPETVKVYRKRVHTKLGLGTTGELFTLFMAALCAAPQGGSGDPLTYLSMGAMPTDL